MPKEVKGKEGKLENSLQSNTAQLLERIRKTIAQLLNNNKS